MSRRQPLDDPWRRPRRIAFFAAGLVSFLFALFWAARLPPWVVGTVRVGRLPAAWWWGGLLLYPVALGVAWAYVRRMTRWEKDTE